MSEATRSRDMNKTKRGCDLSMPVLMGLLAMILLVSATFAVSLGSVPIPFFTVWKIALNQLAPDFIFVDWSRGQAAIVWNLRFPRMILAICVGGGLAVSGCVLQAITRNPLADPYLFGISSGASLGAVLVIVHIGDFIGSMSLPLAAFAGSLLSVMMVMGLTRSRQASAPERVILAGVAASFILMALTNFLIFLGDQRAAHSVVFWMLGGLGGAKWSQVWIPALMLAFCLPILFGRARVLNAMMIGDETATTLGIDVRQNRLWLFVVCAVITGVLVAFSGSIGFIGLMIPHLTRLWLTGDNRRVMPVSLMLGAIFLLWADLAARQLLSPQELPVGVITAAIGGVFFVWFLRRS